MYQNSYSTVSGLRYHTTPPRPSTHPINTPHPLPRHLTHPLLSFLLSSPPSLYPLPPPYPPTLHQFSPLPHPPFPPPRFSLFSSTGCSAALPLYKYIAEMSQVATHPINTPCQHSLSAHPINTPYQHSLSTHPLKSYQHTLSNPIITLSIPGPPPSPITSFTLETQRAAQRRLRSTLSETKP